jgi:hypothetical protein
MPSLEVSLPAVDPTREPLPPDVVLRYRERFARRLPGAPSYAEVVARVKAGTLDPVVLTNLHRWADHDSTWETLVATRGRTEAAPVMQAFWTGGTDSAALDVAAMDAYRKPYAQLCCAERRAVLNTVAADKLASEPIPTPSERTSRP